MDLSPDERTEVIDGLLALTSEDDGNHADVAEIERRARRARKSPTVANRGTPSAIGCARVSAPDDSPRPCRPEASEEIDAAISRYERLPACIVRIKVAAHRRANLDEELVVVTPRPRLDGDATSGIDPHDH